MKHAFLTQPKMTPSGSVLPALPGRWTACSAAQACSADVGPGVMAGQAMEAGTWEEPWKKANSFGILSWLPDMDLNHDKQIQSLLCYRYTIGQLVGR